MPAALATAFVLRCRLEELLAGVITLAEFDEWLTGVAWDDAGLGPDAVELAGHVGLLIDEYSGGAWTWPELKDRLEHAAHTVVVAWGGDPLPPRPIVTTGATSLVIRELELANQR